MFFKKIKKQNIITVTVYRVKFEFLFLSDFFCFISSHYPLFIFKFSVSLCLLSCPPSHFPSLKVCWFCFFVFIPSLNSAVILFYSLTFVYESCVIKNYWFMTSLWTALTCSTMINFSLVKKAATSVTQNFFYESCFTVKPLIAMLCVFVFLWIGFALLLYCGKHKLVFTGTGADLCRTGLYLHVVYFSSLSRH